MLGITLDRLRQPMFTSPNYLAVTILMDKNPKGLLSRVTTCPGLHFAIPGQYSVP